MFRSFLHIFLGLVALPLLLTTKVLAGTYPELENGFSVRIQAVVDGVPRPGSGILLKNSEKAILVASISHNGQPVAISALKKKYGLTFWWYKVVSGYNTYID